MRYGAEEHWQWILSTPELAGVRAGLLRSSGEGAGGRGAHWARTLRQLGYLLPPRLRPFVRELLLASGDARPRLVALGPRLTDHRRVGRLQDVCVRRLRRLGGLPAEADSAAERAFLARTLATIDPAHEPILRRAAVEPAAPADAVAAREQVWPGTVARRP